MINGSNAGQRSDDAATVIAVGVLAATLADVWHEAVGHGLGCVAVGGRITLLTSIWFRCRGATALTDAGGPLASVIAGAVVLAVLPAVRPSRSVRLLAVLFAAISLFWFAAQLVFHALLNGDDWYFVARQMGWPPVWRPISVALGVVTYAAAVRVVIAAFSIAGPGWLPPVRLAYAAGVASAAIAGLLWRPEPIRGALEALLTLSANPLGLLLAARWADRGGRQAIAAAPIARSWGWIVTSALFFATFVLVQGRGLGSLAGAGLHGGA